MQCDLFTMPISQQTLLRSRQQSHIQWIDLNMTLFPLREPKGSSASENSSVVLFVLNVVISH